MILRDRLALITGGGRGIGRAIAAALAREGAHVALLGRGEAELDGAAGDIRDRFGVRAEYRTCDVSKPEAVARAFAEVAGLFGRSVEILVNNAGIAESAPLTRTTDELWRRHIETNLSGAFYCMRAALPSMIERGWGRIINIASVAGKTGAPYIAAYSASKHGLLGLTRSAALEAAQKGITVNAICPGYADTEMTERAVANIVAKTGQALPDATGVLARMNPQNRLVTPEEVAAVALLLSSEEGRGINGQAINVDGGMLAV